MAQTDPAALLLERQTPEVRALLQHLRPLVMEALPTVREKVHLGWGVIHYVAGPRMSDMVIALVPQRTYVNLEFADGVELPDPGHRLEGTGKRLRHVKVRTAEDADHPDVRLLLRAAASRRGL